MKKIALASIVSLAISASCFAGVPATCNGCHGADGSKNTMVPASKPNTMKKADIIASLKGYRAGTQNTYKKGIVMKNFAKSLSDTQINEIAEAWGK